MQDGNVLLRVTIEQCKCLLNLLVCSHTSRENDRLIPLTDVVNHIERENFTRCNLVIRHIEMLIEIKQTFEVECRTYIIHSTLFTLLE